MNTKKSNVVLTLILLIASCFSGCKRQEIPEITAGVDACSHCRMVIDQVNQACGYFDANGFVTFDSPACLLRQIEQADSGIRPVSERIHFADYSKTGFVRADSTYFLLTEQIPTVMQGGVICFASELDAVSHNEKGEGEITDWEGYQVLKGTPDLTIKATITPTGMHPEMLIVNKNEIVEWLLYAEGLPAPIVVRLRGYEELGEIVVPVNGDPVSIRMRASKPGEGFPLVRKEGGEPVGMLKVIGAHTSDEEAM